MCYAMNYLPRSYGRLLENQKTGGSRKLLLPKNDFQTSSTKNVPKKYSGFGGLETNQRHEKTSYFSHFLLHMYPIQYENCFGHLIGTYS